MNREEADNGVRATAICPAFVATKMTDWTGLPAEEMIQVEDVAELVRTVLKLSPRARASRRSSSSESGTSSEEGVWLKPDPWTRGASGLA